MKLFQNTLRAHTCTRKQIYIRVVSTGRLLQSLLANPTVRTGYRQIRSQPIFVCIVTGRALRLHSHSHEYETTSTGIRVRRVRVYSKHEFACISMPAVHTCHEFWITVPTLQLDYKSCSSTYFSFSQAQCLIIPLISGISGPELSSVAPQNHQSPCVPGTQIYQVLAGTLRLWLSELCSKVLNPGTLSATNLS